MSFYEKTSIPHTQRYWCDTVLMDLEAYNKREDDLAVAQRLLAAEQVRLQSVKGYETDEFERNMRAAIAKGAAHGTK